MKALKHHI